MLMKIIWTFILAVIIVAIYIFQIHFSIKSNFFFDDYIQHLSVARLIYETDDLFSDGIPIHILVHSLYHNIVNIVYKISGFDYYIIGVFIVPILFRVFLGVFLYNFLLKEAFISFKYFYVFLVAISLLFLSPITFFTYPKMYFGYILPNTYHSPTQILAHFFGCALFVLLCKSLFIKHNNIFIYFGLFLLIFLSSFAKPSYLISIPPALVVLLVIFYAFKKYINLKILLFFLVFVLSFLLVQFVLTYILGNKVDNEEGVSIVPFGFILFYDTYFWIFPKFIFSILFPIVVYIIFFDKARYDYYFNFAWLIFFFSCVFLYFFLENGIRAPHGNFGWGSQIALFNLFLVAVRFILRNFPELWSLRKKQILVVSSIYGLHLVCGLLYLRNIMTGLDSW